MALIITNHTCQCNMTSNILSTLNCPFCFSIFSSNPKLPCVQVSVTCPAISP